jgi:hypothetical protein
LAETPKGDWSANGLRITPSTACSTRRLSRDSGRPTSQANPQDSPARAVKSRSAFASTPVDAPPATARWRGNGTGAPNSR